MNSTDTLADKMEQIADKLADELLAGETNADHVDTFKALSLYYVQTRKLGKRRTEDDDDGPNFGKIRRQLSEAENGARQN